LGKPTKNQLLRDKTEISVKQSKQTTFDVFPESCRNESPSALGSKIVKQIIITEIEIVTKEDELELKVGFRLFPSKFSFSKVFANLYFDGQKLNSLLIRILQGPLSTEESEFTFVFDMTGICAGLHVVKVEMCELWSDGEKLSMASKEMDFEYLPVKREDRLIEIPTVKSFAGVDLEVASDGEKNIYREIEENAQKELISKQDRW
jgi:hypothetical protein